MVRTAVENDAEALGLAPAAPYRSDKKIVLAAVRQKPLTLRFADPALRENRKLVLEAVTQNGLALRFAAPALLADPEVATAAVATTGAAPTSTRCSSCS